MTKFIEQRVDELENEVAELKLIIHELRGKKSIEPSTTNTVEDIIEFEGQRYRKVDRKARKGDVVIFRNQTNNHIPINNTPYLIDIDDEYIEIDVDEYCVYSEIHNRNLETVDVYELIETKPLTPNQQRAAIIEKAKKFVEDQKQEFYGSKLYQVGSHMCDADFRINEEKRAITCLLRHEFNGLISKGIAKCDPGDVFNEHIGKSIALGRALGLDVSEFEQAVQPTEFVVGQLVKENRTNSYIEPFEISSIEKSLVSITKLVDADGTWISAYECVIINDTNAKYEV